MKCFLQMQLQDPGFGAAHAKVQPRPGANVINLFTALSYDFSY